MAKTKLSLGKSLIRDRFKRGKNAIINPDGSLRHTFDPADDPVNMKSITHENDLEAFLTTATLAGTDFIAEKLNLSLVVEPNANLLTEEQGNKSISKKNAKLKNFILYTKNH
jgi:large subunit GTPase 1